MGQTVSTGPGDDVVTSVTSHEHTHTECAKEVTAFLTTSDNYTV